MLQQIRERLSLLLIALLPLHALLVTVGTRMLKGLHHAPLIWLALWKEILMCVILGIIFLEFCTKNPKSESRSPNSIIQFDLLDWLIGLFAIVSVFVTAFTHNDWVLYVYGAKYVLFPLAIFTLARRVQWSDNFAKSVRDVLVFVGALVAVFGIIAMVLPMSFFEFLGYSAVHSLYFSDGPISAFQQIGNTGIRRLQSTFSGPNQAGLWLIIPCIISIIYVCKHHMPDTKWFEKIRSRILKKSKNPYVLNLVLLGIVGLALLLSYSRSAWIAMSVAGVCLLYRYYNGERFRGMLVRVIGIGILLSAFLLLIAPDIIIRLGSSRGHIERPIEAVQTMAKHPFGLGLGMAGPASHRNTDTCVHLRPQDDPTWAKPMTNLCVFLGDTQVQPTDRVCTCPNLPENWYLQIGVELGWIGFLLFLAIIYVLLHTLRHAKRESLAEIVYIAFLGISTACLFLHAWESSPVAYTLWLLAGVVWSRREVECEI